MKNIIRPITKADENFLFLIRNNKKIRKEFLNSEKIFLEEHKQWFKKIIKSKFKFIYIILRNKQKIGFIKYEKKEFFYDISFFIS